MAVQGPGGGGHPGGCPGGNGTPPGSTPPQQTGGARHPGGSPPTTPPGLPQSSRYINPWASLDRSRKPLPKLSLPSNYKSCSILDQQMLEVWYDKSTFAIATWSGDAQRYWLTQVLDCARARHDQWLHKELFSSQPISWEIGSTSLKHRMQSREYYVLNCSK